MKTMQSTCNIAWTRMIHATSIQIHAKSMQNPFKSMQSPCGIHSNPCKARLSTCKIECICMGFNENHAIHMQFCMDLYGSCYIHASAVLPVIYNSYTSINLTDNVNQSRSTCFRL
ncbi:unnamed protein product [Owenia fusiformis]|uniref:Uncharacterized protein n=1 Tax=Owenia fusiformis TaxID=6347 RepID=A0A8J1TIV5_OWEFU|nr:unnamed protein product [Owenia fusiformis]